MCLPAVFVILLRGAGGHPPYKGRFLSILPILFTIIPTQNQKLLRVSGGRYGPQQGVGRSPTYTRRTTPEAKRAAFAPRRQNAPQGHSGRATRRMGLHPRVYPWEPVIKTHSAKNAA